MRSPAWRRVGWSDVKFLRIPVWGCEGIGVEGRCGVFGALGWSEALRDEEGTLWRGGFGW